MQIKKNNKSQKAVRIILCLLFCIGLGTAIFFCVKNYTNIYSVQAQIISEREIDIEDSIEIIFNQRVVYFNSENIKISRQLISSIIFLKKEKIFPSKPRMLLLLKQNIK